MNVLFLTLGDITDINQRGIYTDLIRKFKDEGHHVSIVCPLERRLKLKTALQRVDGVDILRVFTLNIKKTNVIEKGLGTLLIEHQYLKAIKAYLRDKKFDLVLYSTPPITFTKIIRYIKKRDGAKTYLLLKDIFPQNAVDLNMIKEGGLIHRFFRQKEKNLYAASDFIGCMSQANVDFVLKENVQISALKVEVNPNSLEPVNFSELNNQKETIKELYQLPANVPICIYGGNLGKPQGIDFLIEVLESNRDRKDVYFVVVGTGTEAAKLKLWFEKTSPKNSKILDGLPKTEYDKLLSACDIGLIFLDHRFTIPNFPSRLLSYLELKIPILAATDVSTDIGRIAEGENFGYWCESGDLESFQQKLQMLINDGQMRKVMGENGYTFMMNNYTSSHSYEQIIKHLLN